MLSLNNNFGSRPGPFSRPPFPGGASGGGERGQHQQQSSSSDENRINERIRVPQVLVIDEVGTQLGVFPTDQAIRMAREKGLDLVEVAPTARPPVCKILDYGKLKYVKKKKAQEAKKKQSVVNVKEIQLRPRTEEHDFQTKLRHIIEFLEDGDKVKITVMFRGREVAYTQQGMEMMNRIVEAVKEIGNPEQYPKLEGKRMMMVIGPGKSAPKPTTPTPANPNLAKA